MTQKHLLPQSDANQDLGGTLRQAVVNVCFSSSEGECAYARRK